MKVYKKITALAVALTMGCSVAAFAACTPKDEEETVNNNLPTGTPAQTVDTVFASALTEENNYLSLNYTGKVSGTEINSVTVNGVEKSVETTTYEKNTTVSGRADLKNGDADLVAKMASTYESTDADKDFTSLLKYNNYTGYAFIRDWNAFTYDTPDNKEVTDFSGLQLEYGSSFKIDWEEILGQLVSTGGSDTYGEEASDAVLPDLSVLPQAGDLISLGLLGENVVLVRLAAAANTLNYENGVYSIDLIKTVDAVIKEVGSVIAALENKNTVGDILNNAIIKKYYSVITGLVPVETVKDTVATAIDAISANEDLQSFIPDIRKDLDALKTIDASTAYDYIVSLVSSQSLVNILNALASSAPADTASGGALFTKTFDKYTVGEILSFVNSVVQTDVALQDLQVIYKYAAQSVCDGEKLVLGFDTVITELSVEYSLENGKLASQKINFVYEEEDSYALDNGVSSGDGADEEVTGYYTVTKEKQEGSLEITFEASAPSLVDISANAVAYTEYEWNEDELYGFSANDYNGEGGTQNFYVGAQVVDGVYAGLKLYDGTVVQIGEGTASVGFQVGDTSYIIYESSRISEDGRDYVEFYVDADNIGIETEVTLYQKKITRTSTVAEFLTANA